MIVPERPNPGECDHYSREDVGNGVFRCWECEAMWPPNNPNNLISVKPPPFDIQKFVEKEMENINVTMRCFMCGAPTFPTQNYCVWCKKEILEHEKETDAMYQRLREEANVQPPD